MTDRRGNSDTASDREDSTDGATTPVARRPLPAHDKCDHDEREEDDPYQDHHQRGEDGLGPRRERHATDLTRGMRWQNVDTTTRRVVFPLWYLAPSL